jgi:drug/metabolite transporter (DMT)-like permease
MGMRGAIFIVPIALVYVFITSQTPIADIGKGLIVVALAMLGGALGGLAYSVIGRPLRRRGAFGRYLAGIVTLAPYMFVLSYIIDFTKGQSLLRHPSRENVIIAVLMAIFFGTVMGRSWFGNSKKDGPARPAT